jgi:hypothetical protein
MRAGAAGRESGAFSSIFMTLTFVRSYPANAECAIAGLIHVADPAVRLLAIWLTMQVIACPASPPRFGPMRLGRPPQVDFLGPWQHDGLVWLTCG